MIFLYDDDGIEWGTGLAGINAGDGVSSITIPESRTVNIRNIDQTSNVGIPGVWVFQVDGSMFINAAITFSKFYTYGIVKVRAQVLFHI